ncbi:MAG TPA: GNAT family N-acetyltransferase [Tepidisphaeraceae bacterium]|nr:GNAT family N-acetyltransferase [Tepidisphaeraceae bacterium]
MPLPILKVSSIPTTETLVRYFHQTQSNWSAHVAEKAVLDCGTAWTNKELNRVFIANRMMDVALADGISPAQAMQMVDEHFAAQGSACRKWVMNPSAPAEQTSPMVEHLAASGFARLATQIMYLDRIPSTLPGGPMQEQIQVIPARASFRHARALHESLVKGDDVAQRIEARMLHLDDPHYDALLALRQGQAVGMVGVLAMGEVGLITQMAVVEAFQRQGIGTMLLGRALEICARSLFKHVMLDVRPAEEHAHRLYERFGFKQIGEFAVYQRD